MSGKIFFTWHLEFLPSFRFFIKYKTVRTIMHLLFHQFATQSLLPSLSVVTWHLCFSRFIFFSDYSAFNDISLFTFSSICLTSLLVSRLTNYLAFSLIITFLYESWNLTFIFHSTCNAYFFCAEDRCLLLFFMACLEV